MGKWQVEREWCRPRLVPCGSRQEGETEHKASPVPPPARQMKIQHEHAKGKLGFLPGIAFLYLPVPGAWVAGVSLYRCFLGSFSPVQGIGGAKCNTEPGSSCTKAMKAVLRAQALSVLGSPPTQHPSSSTFLWPIPALHSMLPFYLASKQNSFWKGSETGSVECRWPGKDKGNKTNPRKQEKSKRTKMLQSTGWATGRVNSTNPAWLCLAFGSHTPQDEVRSRPTYPMTALRVLGKITQTDRLLVSRWNLFCTCVLELCD